MTFLRCHFLPFRDTLDARAEQDAKHKSGTHILSTLLGRVLWLHPMPSEAKNPPPRVFSSALWRRVLQLPCQCGGGPAVPAGRAPELRPWLSAQPRDAPAPPGGLSGSLRRSVFLGAHRRHRRHLETLLVQVRGFHHAPFHSESYRSRRHDLMKLVEWRGKCTLAELFFLVRLPSRAKPISRIECGVILRFFMHVMG